MFQIHLRFIFECKDSYGNVNENNPYIVYP